MQDHVRNESVAATQNPLYKGADVSGKCLSVGQNAMSQAPNLALFSILFVAKL
jgi:hypothetical protein